MYKLSQKLGLVLSTNNLVYEIFFFSHSVKNNNIKSHHFTSSGQ